MLETARLRGLAQLGHATDAKLIVEDPQRMEPDPFGEAQDPPVTRAVRWPAPRELADDAKRSARSFRLVDCVARLARRRRGRASADRRARAPGGDRERGERGREMTHGTRERSPAPASAILTTSGPTYAEIAAFSDGFPRNVFAL